METAKPRTTLLMLLLWTLLCGATVGSTLPNRELQMLEMMQSILRADSADLSGRNQRSVPLLYASSVPCDDSLAEDTSDQLSLFDEDFDSSEECRECQDRGLHPTGLEPCPQPLVPRQHPCYVRVVILRTPLMEHDPCTNFTLGPALPARARASVSAIASDSSNSTANSSSTNTTSTTTMPTTLLKSRRKGKRCRSKTPKGEVLLGAVNPTQLHGNDTASSTAAPDSSTSGVETTNSTTPITTVETTTEMNATETSIPTEIPTTTSLEPNTIPTLPPTTTTEASPLNLLKSARGRRRRLKKKRGRARVPNKPKIKLDGAMQPSVKRPVFLTTEASKLRSRAGSTTMRPEAVMPASATVTQTTECVEDSDDVKARTESGEIRARAGQGEANDPEDCIEAEDAEDQNTNICPQFSPPEEADPMRLMPSRSHYRKPVKNYVEPILYEGQFAKPRQRTRMLPPGKRDFYVSNKQIMPRPRPKVREPMPHSIYMNNIVRGIKCSDESDPYGHPGHGSHSSNPARPANEAHSLHPPHHSDPAHSSHPLHPSHAANPLHPPRPFHPSHSANPSHPSHPLHPSHPANHLHPSHPLHPSNCRYHPRHPPPGQRDWPGRRNGPDYGPIGPQPDRSGHQRGRGNPTFVPRSGEDPDCYVHESDQYYDDDADNAPWHGNHPLHPATSTSDPCQAEHSREAERRRQRQRENDRDEHLQDYPHRSAPQFFT